MRRYRNDGSHQKANRPMSSQSHGKEAAGSERTKPDITDLHRQRRRKIERRGTNHDENNRSNTKNKRHSKNLRRCGGKTAEHHKLLQPLRTKQEELNRNKAKKKTQRKPELHG
ncbi:unnamed protein product [Microthlaspi erraticum]|uniref:Uncharacterized protein n=1 Tax=Microthlaspi erraticum TaxID=1685480 RepID=A0A6D2K965_9BRAS|nr:unnamed protein product [Microthlaspi erraticum]